MSGDTSGGKHEQGLSLDAEEFSSVFFRLYLFKGVPCDVVCSASPPRLSLIHDASRAPACKGAHVRMARGARDHLAWTADDVLPARQPWPIDVGPNARHSNELLWHM